MILPVLNGTRTFIRAVAELLVTVKEPSVWGVFQSNCTSLIVRCMRGSHIASSGDRFRMPEVYGYRFSYARPDSEAYRIASFGPPPLQPRFW